MWGISHGTEHPIPRLCILSGSLRIMTRVCLSTLCQWEHGKRSPEACTVQRLLQGGAQPRGKGDIEIKEEEVKNEVGKVVKSVENAANTKMSLMGTIVSYFH